jgi:hypothetical protein
MLDLTCERSTLKLLGPSCSDKHYLHKQQIASKRDRVSTARFRNQFLVKSQTTYGLSFPHLTIEKQPVRASPGTMDGKSQRVETQSYDNNLDRTLKELQEAVFKQEAELSVVRFPYPFYVPN